MPRRLIVNADDFGLSPSVNQAVLRAHREGILTTASLMVGEPGFDEAVAMARENPGLGVGLHLTLLCGQATLAPGAIPGLVDDRGRFSDQPARVGCRYFFRASLRAQLQAEMEAQFQKFHATGLTLDHVNGHLHLHLHPTVLGILMEQAQRWGITRMRLTRDPFWLNARLAPGRWLYRAVHAAIYAVLARRARPALARRGIRHTGAVFGLLQNARVDEAYVLKVLPELAAGDSELYSHPSLDQFRHELDGLISPRVRELVQRQKIKLIRYQDI